MEQRLWHAHHYVRVKNAGLDGKAILAACGLFGAPSFIGMASYSSATTACISSKGRLLPEGGQDS